MSCKCKAKCVYLPAFTLVLGDFYSMLRDNSRYWLFHSEAVHVNPRFCWYRLSK